MQDVVPSNGPNFGRFDAGMVPAGEGGDMYELFLSVESIRNLGIWDPKR
jgi:hypothetical protein